APARLLVGVQHALDAELDGLRVEVLAVVELDAGSQLEVPRGGVDRRPRGGHAGLVGELAVLDRTTHEVIEHVVHDGEGAVLRVHVGIERGGVRALGDGDLSFGCGNGAGRRPRGGEGDRDEGGGGSGRAAHGRYLPWAGHGAVRIWDGAAHGAVRTWDVAG